MLQTGEASLQHGFQWLELLTPVKEAVSLKPDKSIKPKSIKQQIGRRLLLATILIRSILFVANKVTNMVNYRSQALCVALCDVLHQGYAIMWLRSENTAVTRRIARIVTP